MFLRLASIILGEVIQAQVFRPHKRGHVRSSFPVRVAPDSARDCWRRLVGMWCPFTSCLRPPADSRPRRQNTRENALSESKPGSQDTRLRQKDSLIWFHGWPTVVCPRRHQSMEITNPSFVRLAQTTGWWAYAGVLLCDSCHYDQNAFRHHDRKLQYRGT